jgi:hypothetical protein
MTTDRLDGVVALLAGVFLSLGALVFFFRFLVGYAMIDLHDFFEEGSLLYGMVHTNFWLIIWPLGALFGIFHKWVKDEGILAQGLDEWRAWRAGRPAPSARVDDVEGEL